VVYRGSGVPDKKVDPVKRAHLERKLEKKLGDLNEKRAHKTKDKK
jgi:ATP-dependent RNA/DNA helicase IGHMBP2